MIYTWHHHVNNNDNMTSGISGPDISPILGPIGFNFVYYYQLLFYLYYNNSLFLRLVTNKNHFWLFSSSLFHLFLRTWSHAWQQNTCRCEISGFTSWCFIASSFYQCDVICVNLDFHHMYQQTIWEPSVMLHGLYIDNGLLEPFCLSILLWWVRHWHLVFNSVLFQVCLLFIWKEVSTPISSFAF